MSETMAENGRSGGAKVLKREFAGRIRPLHPRPDRFDSPPMFVPWAGFALFCVYVATTLGGAAVLVQRRNL